MLVDLISYKYYVLIRQKIEDLTNEKKFWLTIINILMWLAHMTVLTCSKINKIIWN